MELYRKHMSSLSFALGQRKDSTAIANEVNEWCDKKEHSPVRDVNPWAMIGTADALMVMAIGRIQALEDALIAADAEA